MIITIKGADFSAANIGTLSTYIISKSIGSGAVYEIPNFVEKNSSATWTITLNEGYTFGTYSVTMGGETVTPTVADNVMTISIPSVTGNVRIVVATINESTGEEDNPIVPPVEPEIPTTTTWYVDHRNNSAKLTSSVNKAGRGWCHEVNTPAYNAYVGKPVNTVAFFTKFASQEVTVMVGTTNSTPEQCRLIGTFTATNSNGSSKGLASITFPTLTLNQGEHLILFAQASDAIDFYYATAAVNDANGLVDTGFHGRVPKVYGTGTAWQQMSKAGTYTLGWSIGYVI